MAEPKLPRLGTGWLVELFSDCGLEGDQAKGAAEAVRRRLVLRIHRAKSSPKRFAESLVRDPLVSFNRLVGLSDAALPFLSEADGKLSEIAFGTALAESGLDPDVGLAFGKVAIEIIEVGVFYQPIWEALGQEGDVDLDELRRLDWSPLREGLDLPKPYAHDPDKTEVVRKHAPLTADGPGAPVSKPRPKSEED